jgi:ketosteroid isomerase-like protein
MKEENVKRVLSLAIPVLMLASGMNAQTPRDSVELTGLLKDFLAGASRNDAAMHDRFWAGDLIYTGSSGRRIGKAEIMRDLRAASATRPGSAATTYTAEDIRIQQYGDTAIVAFRLVAATTKDGVTPATSYLNTGTFLKRNGKWQAVSWQATKIPLTEAEASKQVTAAHGAIHQGLLAADVKQLESVLDESFVWTHSSGDKMTRQQLLDQLASGQLKYSKLETSNVTVSVYSDAAVVRGASSRQRSVYAGSNGAGDTGPFTVFYTLTLINKSGDWKAVAMHTSRL